MGHPLRVEAPGESYHLTSRGNDGGQTFFDTIDFEAGLRLLARTAQRHGWVVLAYCLMTNHLHLVVRLTKPGMSAGMRELVGGYAARTNRRHGRRGHLFENRFSSTLIESEAHLLESLRYVVLNPVRARICRRPDEWRWSSYRACAGLELAPPFLAVHEVLALFGRHPAAAARAYRAFVRAGLV
jgi:putative transposase